nr:reverse transcriptase domain-containing protein [Tanacetum cinerariifolium]
MTDNRTMAEMLRAPTEGCAEAIVVPPILAEKFELKHSRINMMTSEQFFGIEKDNPHDHKFDESFHEACERYKDLLRTCPHHGFTELHQLDTFYNALNPADQDSLNAAAGGNLLEKSPQDALTIIENKSKVRNSQSKPIASPVNACDNHSSSELAKLTHAVNQQTSAVTTAMTAMLKQFQSNPPPAHVKAVEEICVTCGGAHLYYQCLATDGNTFPKYRDNIQGCAEAIVVPPILAEKFELKHSLINMMTSEKFFGLEKENPHDHNPHAKIFYIKRQKEPGKSKEEVYSNSKIVQVIKTYSKLGHEHKFVIEIIARRANGSIVSITEPNYKNLKKNDSEDMYLLCINGKKVNLTAPTVTFLGIDMHKMFFIVFEPIYGIIYKNNKKEKRVMRHQEIHKFCDATLKRVLEGLTSYNNDVKHDYVTPSLSKEDAEYLQLFEEEIKERLKYHDQMRR